MDRQNPPVLVLFNAASSATRSEDREAEAGVVEAAEAALNSLREAGYQVDAFGLADDFLPLVERLRREPAVVVNFCEAYRGRPAGEGYITGLLELLDVPYTGSTPDAMFLCLDKIRTKRLLAGAGLPTPAFFEVRSADEVSIPSGLFPAPGVSWPVIVKPAGEDASQGVSQQSIIEELGGLGEAIERTAAGYGYPVLVEQYIDGREFNLAVIEDPAPRLLPVSEILFRTSSEARWPIVTYEAKWSAGSEADLATLPRCPAEIDAELAGELERLALEAFRMTGCRDYARIDIRLARDGQAYLLEVNANPDLGPAAGLARQLAAAGIRYSDFLIRLVERATARSFNQNRRSGL